MSALQATAEIVCRKEPHGVFCAWKGDERGVATVYGELVERQVGKGESPVGRVIRVGDLRVRVLEMVALSSGMYCDLYFVALAHNPLGELQALYRAAARGLLKRVVNVEMRVRAFMLENVFDGREMPFTAWLYRRLL